MINCTQQSIAAHCSQEKRMKNTTEGGKMSSDQRIDELNRKLDLVVRLLAYQLVSGKTLSHGAPILKRIGLTA